MNEVTSNKISEVKWSEVENATVSQGNWTESKQNSRERKSAKSRNDQKLWLLSTHDDCSVITSK